MSAPDAVEFAGTDDELEKVLLEFARGTGGWAARDPRRSGWTVAGGALLSTNPNFVPWRIEISRREGRLELAERLRSLPWTRAKAARLAAHRKGQLADYLVTRLRGGDPGKFDRRRLAEPFAPFGADVAAVSMSFAWVAACMLGALAAAAAAATLASLPLLGMAFSEIAVRSRAVESAGGVALPTAAELASIGTLGGALLFALPLAFFSTVVHSAALLAGELWARAARMGQASFLFQFILLTLALFPFLPFFALPLALLVPLGTHLGYTLAWGRRRERLRDGPPPDRRLVFAGLVLAAAFAASIVPWRSGGIEFTDRLALFRDRFLLGTGGGRAAAAFYYRHTLYAADPLKPFYSRNPAVAVRSLRTVHLKSEEFRPFFRALHFTVVADAAADVTADGESFVSGGRRRPVRDDRANPEKLKEHLDALASEAFRGTTLRELSYLSWRAVAYAGPPFALAVLLGAFCPGVSFVFRRLPRRRAITTLAVCFAVAAGVILWDASRHSEERRLLEEMRRDPSRIAPALAHPSPAVRHAAAYLAFVHKNSVPADSLLPAADDPDLRVRLWAVGALGKTRDPRALPVLVARLGDPELFVRYRAAEGLGFLGQAGAAGALLRMTKEGGWYEGLRALEALRRLRPGEF